MTSDRPRIRASDVAEEWSRNWKTVLASGVGIGFTILHFYTLGVFLDPLSATYGWSKSDITLAPVIGPILFFFVAAKIGRFASRMGVRRVVIPGFIAYCVVFAMFGFAGPSLWSWYALWLLLAIVHPFASTSLWALAVASRFSRSRGLALAVALCGTGVASAVAPYATVMGIERFGWSNTYHLIGLTALVVGLPILYFLLPRSPVAAEATAHAVGSDAILSLPGMTFREALRSRPFWILVFASAVLGYGMPTLMLHFVSIGTENGISFEASAAAAGLIGVSAIVGRLTAGLLLDTLPGRFVAAVMFAFPAVACLVLLNVDGSLTMLSLAAAVVGFCTGAEFDVLAVLVSRHMGMREFASINGQVASVFGLGVGFGPALSSLIFDYYDSYTPLLSGLAIVFLLPSMVVLFIGSPQYYGYPKGEGDRAVDERDV